MKFLENAITVVGVSVGITALYTLLVALVVLFGGISGAIIGYFFGDMVLVTLARFGVDILGLTMWQLGGTLAFIGIFFKSTSSKSKD